VCAQTILQVVLNEVDNIKCSFIFNITKNLDDSKLSQLCFKSLWLRMGDEKDFAPKPCKWNQFIFFSQNYSKVIQHGHLEKIGLQHKCLTKSKVRTICSNSPTLQGTQTWPLKHTQLRIKPLLYFIWIHNPKMSINNSKSSHDFMFYFSNFEIKPRVTPSHFSFTLLIAMLKALLLPKNFVD